MKKYQRHHANWERLEWQKSREFPLQRLRSHPSLIIPVLPMNHRLLHWEMESTPKPTFNVATDLLDFLPKHHEVGDRTLGFAKVANWLLNEAMAHTSPEWAESAHKLGSHYVTQLGYIAMQEEAAQLQLMNRVLDAA